MNVEECISECNHGSCQDQIISIFYKITLQLTLALVCPWYAVGNCNIIFPFWNSRSTNLSLFLIGYFHSVKCLICLNSCTYPQGKFGFSFSQLPNSILPYKQTFLVHYPIVAFVEKVAIIFYFQVFV